MTKVADEKAYSIFDVRTLSEIHQEIQQLYLGDSRPWVVGYSGGKDSTTALQLIWYALEELPPEQRQKTGLRHYVRYAGRDTCYC